MKKHHYSLILLSLLFSFGNLLSVKAEDKFLLKENDSPKNVAKLNLSTLFFGNIHLQYERALTNKISVALGASVLIPRGFPVDRFVSNDSSKVNKSELTGFSLTPEVRFYLGKKEAPRGFYIAPYLRYNNYGMDFDADLRVNLRDGRKNQLRNFDGEMTYRSIGGGVMIGAQWLIKDKISIDWWILGLGYNSVKVTAVSKGDFSNLDLENTVTEINNFDSPLINAKGYADNEEIRAEITLPGIGLRGGLTIGYAF